MRFVDAHYVKSIAQRFMSSDKCFWVCCLRRAVSNSLRHEVGEGPITEPFKTSSGKTTSQGVHAFVRFFFPFFLFFLNDAIESSRELTLQNYKISTKKKICFRWSFCFASRLHRLRKPTRHTVTGISFSKKTTTHD